MKYLAVNVDNGNVSIVDDFAYLTDNFLYSELACNDGSEVILYSYNLMRIVQAIRDVVGALSINSAFRTPAYNLKIGGVSDSRHLFGLAVDLGKPKNLTIEQFLAVVEEVAGTEVGIGIYNTFIHLDFGRSARWDNR